MTTKRLGVRAALVDGWLVPGDVEIAEGRIVSLGATPPWRANLAIPGYIDLQVNGFGGVDFLAADPADYEVAGEALASCGVTAYQPTLVCAPPEVTVTAIQHAGKALTEAGPRILGVHLEGPFLATKWKGAHDPRWIVAPDLDLAARLCDAGPVTYVTLAPELPGGFELLDWLTRRGIVVAIGHTDADAEVAQAAFNRGARAVTHLHNAQRRFAARDPGIVGVALTRADVVVPVIADLVHLEAETLLLAWRSAGERLALITDAIAATRSRNGPSTLGGRAIEVSDAARLADGTLAGSVLTMDRAVRNLVELGVPWPAAVAAATSTPARLVGQEDLATLRPRTTADIAVLDDRLNPVRTLRAGREIWAG